MLRVLCLVTLAACSFAMTSVPDNYRAVRGGPPPSCSSSRAAPIADTAGALGFGFIAGIAAIATCAIGEYPKCEPGPPLLLAGGAVIYLVSALRGYRVAVNCGEAIDAHAAAQR